MLLLGGGLGTAITPATESILGSLPRENAGVGSAVNDTTREVGGTLGVAVLGSIMASLYGGRVGDALARTPLPSGLQAAARDSLAAALLIAARTGGTAGARIAASARDAFVHAFQVGSIVTGGVALLGAAVALMFLPARAPITDEITITIPDDDEPEGLERVRVRDVG
jgi:hypothetical protein